VATTSSPGRSSSTRPIVAGAVVAIAVGAVLVTGALFSGALGGPASTPIPVTALASPTSGPTAAESPTIGPTAVPAPTPTSTPGVALVPAPLTGVLVTPAAALRHPIAVMIDDHQDARPQAGFNAASIVWQAPAEGGIPRYMLIFQDKIPSLVGPIRSSREYFIEWAAEWRSMYLHAGGSPQALATLRASGNGSLVWNAEGLAYDGSYLWRVKFRFAPHNLFTDGPHLEGLAKRLGVPQRPIKPVWSFQPDTLSAARPDGARVVVTYVGYESIAYRYDAFTNTYPRFINGSKTPQVDLADGKAVAPTNVVILAMHFGPLNGLPTHGRLEAANVGSGRAWISTGGVTIKGTWRKASQGAPTLLFGPDGRPVVLTAGQTFVEVIKLTDTVQVTAGHAGGPVQTFSRTEILPG
jgi:hypothetical protein